MLNLEEKKNYRVSLHHLGFRPFFLLGGLFAVVSMSVWFLQYHFGLLTVSIQNLPAIYWHGHEMIFGYAIAVIAGFLLTATRNWTNVQTLHGWPLLLLALLWLIARVIPFIEHPLSAYFMATFDLVFSAWLCLAVIYPIIRVKQWIQVGIWVNMLAVCLANLLFYLGMLGVISNGMKMGLYGGLYLVVSLILLMGRRVIPFFIEKGVGGEVHIKNRRWLDNTSIVLVLAFTFVQVFTGFTIFASVLALALALLHMWRLAGWYTQGIWKKPLLWILYIAYFSISLGFVFTALANLDYMNPMLATHAFGYGVIGLMTIGMMARVALGHTGRNVFNPPAVLIPIFAIAIAGMTIRVLFPVILPGLYSIWVGLSQVLWIASFGLFCWIYIPMLIRPRVDGRFG